LADEDDDDYEESTRRHPRKRQNSSRNPGKLTVLHRIAGAGLLIRLMELIEEDSVCGFGVFLVLRSMIVRY
jgi:hypothetical protein